MLVFNPPKSGKIFGTAEASLDLAQAIGNDKVVKRAFSVFKQVPNRFYRDNVIACEGDAAEYIFFVVRGVVRSCRNSKKGVRNIVAFFVPGDFLGWTGLKHRSPSRQQQTQRYCLSNGARYCPSRHRKVELPFFAAVDDQ